MTENDNFPLKEFAVPSNEEPYSSIVRPAIEENNFELDPSLLHMVQQIQFFGSPADDPNLHLSVFVEYCDTKMQRSGPRRVSTKNFPIFP